MRRKSATADLLVAQISARQHGVATARQLCEAGLSEGGIRRRVAAGRFHRLHHGVYAVGHPAVSLEGRWLAAVLACGEGAVLSHRSAAALWELLRPFEGPIEVSVPTHGGRKRRKGIRVHRCTTLAAAADAAVDDQSVATLVIVRNRIPVTSVPRTLEDLRRCVPPKLHRRAVRQAEMAGYALGPDAAPERTRSDLERDFLTLCRAHALPAPEVNVRVGRWLVDFLWVEHGLAVETDSWRWHRGSVAFEDDRARELDLRARGFAVRRFTERQVREEGGRVAADLLVELRECPKPRSSS